MDYYEILGVSKESTFSEIKNKYRDLAKIYHPDKNPDEINKFKKINEAYETLSDPEKRDLYDISINETVMNNKCFINNCANGNFPSFNEDFDREMKKLNEIFSKEPFISGMNFQNGISCPTFNLNNLSEFFPKYGFSSSTTTTKNLNKDNFGNPFFNFNS